MFHLELVPAEIIPNNWIIYNGKADKNRGKNDMLLCLQLFVSPFYKLPFQQWFMPPALI